MRFERVLSGNVNIGIGLMLESLFNVSDRYDNKREIPKHVDIESYDIHLYNIYTVVRNIMQSIKVGKPSEKDVTAMLIDDLNYIHSTYYSNVKTEMILFIPEYKNFIKEFNKNKTINPTKHDEDMVELIDFVHSLDNNKLKGLDVKILRLNKKEKINKKVLLTSSFLLDMEMIGVCDLLESHTGVLKNKYKLYSKYNTIGKKDLSHLPYNKTLHIVLGDKTLVKPYPIGTRNEVHKISIEKKWNSHTSEEKIKDNIKHLFL